ncbi:hypothetical protein OU5_4191 [Pseudomonas mandelii JR-1]|uniref:Uncharacterized protein n=1 Tax=Pseudomonas mandelii JR-1 TaxID=1147786 RepID=A0A024EFE6_9PSED|nr:hypothetical protein OU5_4191 [Pseudomonas mandelii JR-1]
MSVTHGDFSLAFCAYKGERMCACYKRRAKVGPLPCRSGKSRSCVVYVGQAGGVCDAIGTALVTLCTACGTACDRAVLPALQCADGWRMLGHKVCVSP